MSFERGFLCHTPHLHGHVAVRFLIGIPPVNFTTAMSLVRHIAVVCIFSPQKITEKIQR